MGDDDISASIQMVREFTVNRKTVSGARIHLDTDQESELEPVLESMNITGNQIAGQNFSDEIIKNMISGLGDLIVNNVEECSSPSNRGGNKGNIMNIMVPKEKKNLFSLRRMTEICLVNINRIEHFWEIIIDQLMVISV